MQGVRFPVVEADPYSAVRGVGAAVAVLQRSLIRVSGSDRLKFLQGQVSNDVLSLVDGFGTRACVLNNTGHLIADLEIFQIDGCVYIGTDLERGPIVAANLKRFVIRERVEIADVTAEWNTLSVQGARAKAVVELVIDDLNVPQGPCAVSQAATSSGPAFVTQRDRTGSGGYDIWAPPMYSAGLLEATSRLGLPALDSATLDILRIEVATPVWGSELTEQIIPLEAGLDDRISYTKGCYMGQEVIARIHSRGHTNRALAYVKFSAEVAAQSGLVATGGERTGQEVGRITSAAISPRHGAIGLAFLRNDYAVVGTQVLAGETVATVAEAPEATGRGSS